MHISSPWRLGFSKFEVGFKELYFFFFLTFHFEIILDLPESYENNTPRFPNISILVQLSKPKINIYKMLLINWSGLSCGPQKISLKSEVPELVNVNLFGKMVFTAVIK